MISRSALYTKKTFKLSMSMKPKFTYFATLNLPVWCCQHSCSTWQFTTKFTNITLGMHLHIIGPSFCFPPYCTVHVQCTEERDNFQILKGQCHEKSMTFYRMRYCFKPQQWSANWYSSFWSSVKELQFSNCRFLLCCVLISHCDVILSHPNSKELSWGCNRPLLPNH